MVCLRGVNTSSRRPSRKKSDDERYPSSLSSSSSLFSFLYINRRRKVLKAILVCEI